MGSFNGRIVSGRGEAAFFTGLGWVVEQCRAKLGFAPAPGTLNLLVEKTVGERLANCRNGYELSSPDPAFCSARVLPATVEGLPAAVIVPEEKVRVHDATIIEILAPVNLRQALKRQENDPVTVSLTACEDNPRPV